MGNVFPNLLWLAVQPSVRQHVLQQRLVLGQEHQLRQPGQLEEKEIPRLRKHCRLISKLTNVDQKVLKSFWYREWNMISENGESFSFWAMPALLMASMCGQLRMTRLSSSSGCSAAKVQEMAPPQSWPTSVNFSTPSDSTSVWIISQDIVSQWI